MFIDTALAQEKALDLVKTISETPLVGDFKIGGLLDWALWLGGLAALGIMVYAGILYIASAGNPSRREDSIEWIKAAIFGLLLLAGSWLVLNYLNPSILGQ